MKNSRIVVDNKLKGKVKITSDNGVLKLRIPKMFHDHINVKEGTEVIIMPDFSKHGPFLAIWNPEQQKHKEVKEV